MLRTLAKGFAISGLLGVSLLLTPDRLAAEPILGEDQPLTPSAEEPSQNQEANDAMALFKAGDYDGALKAWTEAGKRNREFPPPQTIMAQLYLQANMIKEAKEALQKAMTESPSDPEAYVLSAMVAMQERDAKKAEAMYRKADSLAGAFDGSAKRKQWMVPRIYSGLAGVAESRKDWLGAQKVLEAWLQKDPKNIAAMQRLAYCLFQQKNVDGALAKLREAVKIEPKLLTPEAIIAQYYDGAGDSANAKKWTDAALAAAPKDLRTCLAAGQRAFEAGQLDEARKHALAAARINPKSLEVSLLQASIATFEKNYMAAELFFDAALKQAPNNVAVSNNLALVLIEQKDEAKGKRALEYAEANVKRFPKSPEAASTLGLVLFRLGRLDDAEKALETAAAIAKTDIDTAFAVASVWNARGRKAEAKELLETVLKNPRPAMFRQEAEELLAQLKK
jgi:tetratricopeptide (TPR) repeat protein